MSNVEYAGGLPAGAGATVLSREEIASRRWRAIWRTHFYAGIFAAPFLVLFALTGLVILYSQPIRQWVDHDLHRVTAAGTPVSLDQQEAAVKAAYPDGEILSLAVPPDSTSTTEFSLAAPGHDWDVQYVYVNPYTAEVVGSRVGDVGIIGLSNRLHGYFNNDSTTIKLPGIRGLLGDGPIMQDYIVGDMLLEIAGCWGLVLLVSGLYLWWPRTSRDAASRGNRKLFSLRLGKKGRARWRDLHTMAGLASTVMLLLVLVSGMPWASYWGPNFTSVANKIDANTWEDAPNSSVAKIGDLDRLNHKINWNVGDAAIANSDGSAVNPADLPARISLDTIVAAAAEEGMKPGYSISYPVDGTDEAGNPTYGSFTVSNSWPRKTSEGDILYLDQFSAATLGRIDAWGYGKVSLAVDTMVSTHMGTEFGIVDRILMTVLCLAVLTSVVSAVIMYGKRRRPGSLGLPRRPRDLRMANRLIVITAVMAVLYPLWGVTAIVVLLLDKFVIRKIGRLRRTFGQPDRPAPTPA